MIRENTTKLALQAQDLYDVLEISHQALSFESLADFHQETLTSIERVLGASSSMYGSLSQERQKMRAVGGVEHGVPEGAVARWCTRYQNQDPFFKCYLANFSTTSNHVVLSGDVIDHKDFLASRFYNEFLRPQSIYHVMIIGLKSNEGVPIGVLGLHRSRRDKAFTDKDATKANLLAPSLTGAVERICAREQISQYSGADDTPDCSGRRALRPQRLQQFGLSNREIDVVNLVQQGLTDALIADQLCISVRTVSNHLRAIYEKTAVHNRTALLYRLTT